MQAEPRAPRTGGHDEPAPGGRAAVELAVLRAVRQFGDSHDRMTGSLRHGMGMNASDLAALRLLVIREDQGAPVTPREIAQHLRISTASTTKLLDRLVAAGHARREPHPRDRRARVIALTEASRAEFFRRYGSRLAAMRAAVAEFDDAELEIAERVIRAVSAAIEAEPED
ncbi:MarR family transcriptional regulator [Leucobacter allii]|uniref:MarR family transcriptional regulator n=1 Tax=Leucobacter allii TaxID=2932247 RepID=A0ABY4FNQ6_9MICO|nr:MarR family transcriptional regulator [Leucobacter allii]UOQ57901.1 MarR family transcriptional regulator [Leucobacter allii]UOR02534.1 MarR family transcriptional regulator [Leucobacter allii]